MFENGIAIDWYQPEWIDWRLVRKAYKDSCARARARLESGAQSPASFKDQMIFEEKNYTSGNLYYAIRMASVFDRGIERARRGN